MGAQARSASRFIMAAWRKGKTPRSRCGATRTAGFRLTHRTIRLAPGPWRAQRGFTLVELTLVVLVAGFLAVTTAAAREMLATTRAKALAREMSAVRLAIDSYQDRFHALPGDDPHASTHVTGATTASGAGNGVIDGAWDSLDPGGESTLLWRHLRLAGLMPAAPEGGEGDPRPRHVADGVLGANSATPSQGQVAGLGGFLQVCAGSVPGRMAKVVDRLLDDGASDTGTVRVVAQGAPPASPAIATANIDDGAAYVVCQAY